MAPLRLGAAIRENHTHTYVFAILPSPLSPTQPMRASTFRRLMNLWPPFLFNGIRVQYVSEDWSELRVVLRLRPWNRNYVRTQFGGNLFAMTDPFWMLLAMHQLGTDYFVWDKAGTIDFVAPGREDVYAHFKLEPSVVDELRTAAAGGEKVLRWFDIDVVTRSGEVVARVRKQLYVRLKPKARAESVDAGQAQAA